MNYFFIAKIFKEFYKNHGLKSFIRIFTKSILIKIRIYVQFVIYCFRPSFSKKKFSFSKENLLFDYLNKFTSDPILIEKYMENKFNFLGNNFIDFIDQKNVRSEWIKRNINFSNRRYALKLNLDLISKNYSKKNTKIVKWNFDFLSQYYWNNKKYSSLLKLNYGNGLDVKIPWEISRLQHLTRLAIMGLNERENKNKKKIYSHIILQVFDFIILNPPRFGLNWTSNMEVGIRGSNIALITDILQNQSILDSDQLNILYNSIHDHMKFVIENLEWSKLSRTNHYFSNIVSLIVMANFLPLDNYNKGILSFAYNQLFNEIKNQFHNDGGNKEGSTAYHIFSNEMILIGLYFYKKNPIKDNKAFYSIKSIFNKVGLIIDSSQKLDSSLEKQVYKKVENINYFSSSCLRNDKSFIQIGDNDSGCFFPLNINNISEEQKYLHHNIRGVATNLPFFSYLKRKNIKVKPHINFNKMVNIKVNGLKKKIDKLTKKNKKIFNISFPEKINLRNMKVNSFPDFGLYQFINEDISLSIICKKNFNYFNSGHVHDDNLGIDLVVKRTPIITDPGSFCYSRDLKIRSLYKSYKSHFVPRTSNMIDVKGAEDNFFYTSNFFKAKCQFLDNKSFLGKIFHKNTILYRWLFIKEYGLEIIDFSTTHSLHKYEIFNANHSVSDSYGRLIDKKIIKKELFIT